MRRALVRHAVQAIALAVLASLGTGAGAASAAYHVPLPCDAVRLTPARAAARMLVGCRDRALYLVSLPDDGVLRAWTTTSFPAPAGKRYDAALSDDGRTIAMAFFGGLVAVASAAGDDRLQTMQLDFYPSSVRFSSDGRALWAGRRRLALGPDLHVQDELPVAFDDTNDLAEAPDGSTLAAANADTSLHLYDARSLVKRASYADFNVEPMVLAYTSRGKSLLVGVADGRLVAFNPSTLRPEATFHTPAGTYPTAVWPVSATRVLVAYAPREGGAGRVASLDLVDGQLAPMDPSAQPSAVVVRDGRVWSFRIVAGVAIVEPLGH